MAKKLHDSTLTMDVSAASRLLESLIHRCRELSGDPPEFVASGEADSSLLALMEIAIGHARGVQALADSHIQHGWAALCCARAAFEAGAVASWVGTPALPFEREGRWIGYYRKLGRFYDRQGKLLEASFPGISEELLRAFEDRDSMYRELLKSETEIRVRNPPSIREMLKENDYYHLYSSYAEASEIIHAGPESIIRSRHRVTSGTRRHRYHCDVWSIDWMAAFQMSAWGTTVSCYVALLRNGQRPEELAGILTYHKSINDQIREIFQSPDL